MNGILRADLASCAHSPVYHTLSLQNRHCRSKRRCLLADGRGRVDREGARQQQGGETRKPDLEAILAARVGVALGRPLVGRVDGRVAVCMSRCAQWERGQGQSASQVCPQRSVFAQVAGCARDRGTACSRGDARRMHNRRTNVGAVLLVVAVHTVALALAALLFERRGKGGGKRRRAVRFRSLHSSFCHAFCACAKRWVRHPSAHGRRRAQGPACRRA